MPADMHERTPGVYTRAEGVQELDMLWSNKNSYQREERSPILFFLAGLILGVVTTAAVFLLVVNPPKIQAGDNAMTTPISETINNADDTEDAPAAGSSVRTPGREAGGSSAASVPGGTTHKVESGDTLGSIAGKYYGSTGPDMVEKIQRANNMDSPDSLQIGQELVIPPKSY